ncbi:unnamed protein product [Cyprideis torosa]|uniref:Uncharacterized protein n=1 Tax=Cyprideis torosa TaxID=163714 RepID=A0A7R8ZMD5_9CRUS|nr:unnamed protein product [Cyprideis torosa]CAG0884095.1 unnamed protein product [Cyprideis torosa]
MGGITRLNYEERSPLLQDLNKSRGKAIQVPDSDDERSSSFDFSAEHDGIEHTNLNPDAIRKFQEQLTYLENRVREMERGTERPQCLNLKRTANEVVQSADPQEDSHLQARDKNEVQRITVGIPRSWSSASENTSGIFEEPVPHERVSGHEQEVSTVAVDVEKVDRRFLSQEERYSYKNSITTLEQKCFELEIQLEEFVEREKTVRKQLEDARYAAKKLQEEKRTLEQTVHSSAGRESQELKEMQESFQAIVQERDRRIRRLEADVAHWKREAGEWKEQKFKDERNLKTKVSDLEAELLRSQTANQILQNHLQMLVCGTLVLVIMADSRRVSFTTLTSVPPMARREERVEDPSQGTVRLKVRMGGKRYCFNFADMVSKNSVKRSSKGGRSSKASGGGASGATAPLGEGDEDDTDVRAAAKYFENKYGGSGRKHMSLHDYHELAEGYDDEDSFIDNEEAFEEKLSEDLMPEHGGYYVNVGSVQLRKAPPLPKGIEQPSRRKKVAVISSDSSDSEGAPGQGNGAEKTKNKKSKKGAGPPRVDPSSGSSSSGSSSSGSSSEGSSSEDSSSDEDDNKAPGRKKDLLVPKTPIKKMQGSQAAAKKILKKNLLKKKLAATPTQKAPVKKGKTVKEHLAAKRQITLQGEGKDGQAQRVSSLASIESTIDDVIKGMVVQENPGRPPKVSRPPGEGKMPRGRPRKKLKLNPVPPASDTIPVLPSNGPLPSSQTLETNQRTVTPSLPKPSEPGVVLFPSSSGSDSSSGSSSSSSSSDSSESGDSSSDEEPVPGAASQQPTAKHKPLLAVRPESKKRKLLAGDVSSQRDSSSQSTLSTTLGPSKRKRLPNGKRSFHPPGSRPPTAIVSPSSSANVEGLNTTNYPQAVNKNFLPSVSEQGSSSSPAVAVVPPQAKSQTTASSSPVPSATEASANTCTRLTILPDNLPAEVVQEIEDIKGLPCQGKDSSTETGKSEKFEQLLLRIGKRTRTMDVETRGLIFSHLATALAESSGDLMREARELAKKEEHRRLDEPLERLARAIRLVMPAQEDAYAAELRNLPTDEARKPGPKRGQARKKFYWNEETIEFFSDVVKIKLKMFSEESPEESCEDYVKGFFERNVKNLWPKGWMNARELIKQAKPIMVAHLSKSKRPSPVGPSSVASTSRQSSGSTDATQRSRGSGTGGAPSGSGGKLWPEPQPESATLPTMGKLWSDDALRKIFAETEKLVKEKSKVQPSASSAASSSGVQAVSKPAATTAGSCLPQKPKSSSEVSETNRLPPKKSPTASSSGTPCSSTPLPPFSALKKLSPGSSAAQSALKKPTPSTPSSTGGSSAVSLCRDEDEIKRAISAIEGFDTPSAPSPFNSPPPVPKEDSKLPPRAPPLFSPPPLPVPMTPSPPVSSQKADTTSSPSPFSSPTPPRHHALSASPTIERIKTPPTPGSNMSALNLSSTPDPPTVSPLHKGTLQPPKPPSPPPPTPGRQLPPSSLPHPPTTSTTTVPLSAKTTVPLPHRHATPSSSPLSRRTPSPLTVVTSSTAPLPPSSRPPSQHNPRITSPVSSSPLTGVTSSSAPLPPSSRPPSQHNPRIPSPTVAPSKRTPSPVTSFPPLPLLSLGSELDTSDILRDENPPRSFPSPPLAHTSSSSSKPKPGFSDSDGDALLAAVLNSLRSPLTTSAAPTTGASTKPERSYSSTMRDSYAGVGNTMGSSHSDSSTLLSRQPADQFPPKSSPSSSSSSRSAFVESRPQGDRSPQGTTPPWSTSQGKGTPSQSPQRCGGGELTSLPQAQGNASPQTLQGQDLSFTKPVQHRDKVKRGFFMPPCSDGTPSPLSQPKDLSHSQAKLQPFQTPTNKRSYQSFSASDLSPSNLPDSSNRNSDLSYSGPSSVSRQVKELQSKSVLPPKDITTPISIPSYSSDSDQYKSPQQSEFPSYQTKKSQEQSEFPSYQTKKSQEQSDFPSYQTKKSQAARRAASNREAVPVSLNKTGYVDSSSLDASASFSHRPVTASSSSYSTPSAQLNFSSHSNLGIDRLSSSNSIFNDLFGSSVLQTSSKQAVAPSAEGLAARVVPPTYFSTPSSTSSSSVPPQKNGSVSSRSSSNRTTEYSPGIPHNMLFPSSSTSSGREYAFKTSSLHPSYETSSPPSSSSYEEQFHSFMAASSSTAYSAKQIASALNPSPHKRHTGPIQTSPFQPKTNPDPPDYPDPVYQTPSAMSKLPFQQHEHHGTQKHSRSVRDAHQRPAPSYPSQGVYSGSSYGPPPREFR